MSRYTAQPGKDIALPPHPHHCCYHRPRCGGGCEDRNWQFHDFVLLLDKLTSANINKQFFKGKIPLENEKDLGNGKVSVQSKGTITLLEEWAKSNMRMPNPEPFNEAIIALKKVRKLRQTPAHKLEDNTFDQKYFHEQRTLITR